MNNAVIREDLFKRLWSTEDVSTATNVTDDYWLGDIDFDARDQELVRESLSFDVSSATAFSFPIIKEKDFYPFQDKKQLAYLSTFHGITNTEFDSEKPKVNIVPLPAHSKIWYKSQAPTDVVLGLGSDFRSNSSIYVDVGGVVVNLIYSSQHEDYEAGMDSPFTKSLEQFIKKFGNEFLEKFKSLDSRFNIEILQAAIEVFGRVKHHDTDMYRSWILSSYLSHELSIVRDAASMAIVDLLGKRSISILNEAIDKETNISLKKDMELLLNELME